MPFYRADPDDPGAPIQLARYSSGRGELTPGCRVTYDPPGVGLPEPEHTVAELWAFGPEEPGDESWVTAILDGGTYEVNADHLTLIPPRPHMRALDEEAHDADA